MALLTCLVGVDDEIVNEYGRHLHEMNHRIAERIDGPNPVGFLSLEDFFHRNEELTEIFTTHNMEETQTSNHLDTVVTETARTCRRVMMAGCQIRSETLRARIDNADTATLRLYRGFSRFMQDDIAEHASAVQLSKKQRKDKAFKIAFEMIRVSRSSWSNWQANPNICPISAIKHTPTWSKCCFPTTFDFPSTRKSSSGSALLRLAH